MFVVSLMYKMSNLKKHPTSLLCKRSDWGTVQLRTLQSYNHTRHDEHHLDSSFESLQLQ